MALPNPDPTPESEAEAQNIVDAEVVDDDPTVNVEVVSEDAIVVEESVPEPVVVEDSVAQSIPAEEPVVDEVVVEEAVVVEEPVVAEPVIDAAAGAAAAGAAQPNVVYVQTPLPPRDAGNRGFGTLIAVLGSIVFALSLAVVTYLIAFALGSTSVDFLTDLKFWLPVIIFAIAFVLVALILNRAPWWAHVLLSLVIGFVVYFGTIGAGLLVDWLVLRETGNFADGLLSPFVIIAAVLAREVSLWFGAAIAVRGRKVVARNRVARENFERELAEYRAKYSV